MESAFGSNAEIAILVGLFAVGLVLGVVFRGWASRRDAARLRELETELEAARQEQASYRNDVGTHFARTSELLRTLTLQYRDIYDHLAEGAQRLAPEGSATLLQGSAEALPSGRDEVPVEKAEEQEDSAPAVADSGETRSAPLIDTTSRVDVGTTPRRSVLFLCTGNSCRSQIAEGFARRMAPPGVEFYSAGIKPAGLNPGAIATMAEANVDIRSQHSKDISEIPLEEIDVVVTLCGDARERCPVFPGTVEKIHWPVRDPAQAEGSEEEVAQVFRDVRDEIEIRSQALFERSDLFSAATD